MRSMGVGLLCVEEWPDTGSDNSYVKLDMSAGKSQSFQITSLIKRLESNPIFLVDGLLFQTQQLGSIKISKMLHTHIHQILPKLFLRRTEDSLGMTTSSLSNMYMTNLFSDLIFFL